MEAGWKVIIFFSLSMCLCSGLAVPYLEHTAAALSTADSEGGERSASGRSKETISQLKQAFNEANLPLSLNQGDKHQAHSLLYIPALLSLSLNLPDSYSVASVRYSEQRSSGCVPR